MQETTVFGSLTIDTDATEMPKDLASMIAERVVNMGDALTAFHHEMPSGRRLQGEMNHVVVDFDMAKLGSPFTPTDAAVNDAVKLICGMLDTVECGYSASFKLDESGEAKKVRSNDGAWPVLLGLAGLV